MQSFACRIETNAAILAIVRYGRDRDYRLTARLDNRSWRPAWGTRRIQKDEV